METPKILLVEDDINLRFVTKDNLENKGYTIECYADGQSALAAFGKKSFDLCILDVMLPKMDGFTLAQKIRGKDEDIPILFLTAKSMKEDKIKGLSIGGDDYITKPFSMEELALKIEIFLKRSKISNPQKETASVYTIGQYQFDHSKLLLTSANSSKQLTQKEADLLQYFCVNPDRILKREEILTKIWGDDDYFLGRSLDVFIFRLRKYLKHDKSINIQNIHGVGFKMSIGA